MKKIKNSWSDGLIMDFAPENTSPNSLTSALNATILTYNGNEMMLQNDMGNARIETAFLPEGYIPVGTCEFGDIIYIVSYNPLTNKSQIGCFPSPERNISSDEISNQEQSLSNNDFLETKNITVKNEQDGTTKIQTIPTGKLISSSVKKIIYENNLQPGDKYFIYLKDSEEDLKDSEEDYFKNFSDYDGEGLNSFPKYLKVHVISILDDGKIELLDSSVKWYDKYFIPTIKQSASEKYDIDSYRDALKSGYSIFSSKISGKLALLVELEKITGFNCTYSVIEDPILTTEEPSNRLYKVYWNINWSTNNNDINPKYIVLTKSSVNNKNIPIPKSHSFTENNDYYYETITSDLELTSFSKYTKTKYEKRVADYLENKKAFLAKNNSIPDIGKYYLDAVSVENSEDELKYKDISGNIINFKEIKDDIINNHFQTSVVKYFYNFPSGNYVYEYEITPAMPYGLLDEYAIKGSIDFSKIGTDYINLHTWKYYNTEDNITLTLGLDAYTEENKGIAGITLEFYDAYGLAAAYHINNKESYSGTFTEYIPLNGINLSYKLTNKDSLNNTIKHKGLSLADSGIQLVQNGHLYEEEEGKLYVIEVTDNITNPPLIKNDTIYIHPESNIDLSKCYINDAGTLYSNVLYGVKIIIKNCFKDSLGNLNIFDNSAFKIENRWLWTNRLLNSQYNQMQDFKDAVGDLILDLDISYKTNDKWVYSESQINEPLLLVENASELYKNLGANVLEISGGANIDGTVNFYLQNGYNTFNLNASTLNNFGLKVHLGKGYIESENGTITLTNNNTYSIFEGIYPIEEEIELKEDCSKLKEPILGSVIIENPDGPSSMSRAVTLTVNDLSLSKINNENINKIKGKEYRYLGADFAYIYEDTLSSDEPTLTSLITLENFNIEKTSEDDLRDKRKLTYGKIISDITNIAVSEKDYYVYVSEGNTLGNIYLLKELDNRLGIYNDSLEFIPLFTKTETRIQSIEPKPFNYSIFQFVTIYSNVTGNYLEYNGKPCKFYFYTKELVLDEVKFKRFCNEFNYSKWSDFQCLYFDNYLPDDVKIKLKVESNYSLNLYDSSLFLQDSSADDNMSPSGTGGLVSSLRPSYGDTVRIPIGNSFINNGNDVLVGEDGLIGLPNRDTNPLPEIDLDDESSNDIIVNNDWNVVISGLKNYNNLACCTTTPYLYSYTFEIDRLTCKSLNGKLVVVYFKIPVECRYKDSEGHNQIVNFDENKVRILIPDLIYTTNSLVPLINLYKDRNNSYKYTTLNYYLFTRLFETTEQNTEALTIDESNNLIENKELFIKISGITKPDEKLNTEKWAEFKNQYTVSLVSAKLDDTELNYLNYNQEEVELNDHVVLRIDNLPNSIDPINLEFAFSAIHYSKYYKETALKYSTLSILEPLLNTKEDLIKYNMDIKDKHLYFNEIIALGVGHGDAHHNFMTLFGVDERKGFNSDTKLKTSYDSNKGRQYMGITKTTKETYYNLWERELSCGGLVKDLVPNIMPVIFGVHSSKTSSIQIVKGADFSAYVDPNTAFVNNFIDPFLSITKDYLWKMDGKILNLPGVQEGYEMRGDGEARDAMNLCSFLMKDSSGNIHALNNLFPLFALSNSGGELLNRATLNDKSSKGCQIIKYKSFRPKNTIDLDTYIQEITNAHLPLTIADVAGSLLSNVYKLSEKSKDLETIYTTNTIYLTNQLSKYVKDIVYEFNCIGQNGQKNYLKYVNILGVSVDTYADQIITHMNATNDFKNTLKLGINDIVKNVPLLFNFNYKPVDVSEQFNETNLAYVKTNDSYDYSVMSLGTSLNSNSLYYINSSNIIQEAYSYLPYKNIKEVEMNKEGFIKFTYYDELQEHTNFDYFLFKEGELVLTKTSYPATSMYALKTPEYEVDEVISGFVKYEYLTTLGKYAD